MNRFTEENAARRRLSTSALVQFLARIQMSFGGEPERILRSSKSESFETNCEIVALSIFPNRRIVCAAQSTLMNMGRTRIEIGQLLVLNKAGDRCCPSPTVESNLNGRLEGPRKKDPAAMNSPKHMRQRCRAMRFAPRTPPRASMRASPADGSI